MSFLIVGLGGFLGAILRYSVYLLEQTMGIHSFPIATLCINTLGSFLAGIMLIVLEKNSFPPQLILFGTMGFVGSFTTFSTFAVESFTLVQSGRSGTALLSISLSLILGLIAIELGRRFGLTLY